MDDSRPRKPFFLSPIYLFPFFTRWHLFVVAGFLLAATVYGCQLMGTREIDSPLSYSAQQSKIIEIAPKGTARDEAIAQLNEAGVAGEFSRGKSTYYCGSWTQKNGVIWRTNVALLFDEEGTVIGTRPIEAEVGLSSSTTPADNHQTAEKAEVVPITLPTTSNPARNGLRRPFDDE
ncbi:hypothetical protein MNBD_PLANCTO02-1460 [hydrothermal vent metagenome]|uniref:Uncharacterized protein n=1 Tax=hydrothermal vent metagenome TaxID=652676 RepID=A0A3B1E091_9ZZZZ